MNEGASIAANEPFSPSVPASLTAVRFVALWMLGMTLRVTLLAVPPLIPTIHSALGLSETGVSLLTSLPILLLSVGAVVGSLLIFRVGIRNAVIVGVITVAAFSAGRGVLGSRFVLFGCTLMMGLGVAVLQPSMPALVKEWFPAKVGIATAIYSNGMLVGQVLGAGLTLPLMLPLAGGSWAGALALWSLPVAATAAILSFAARDGRGAPAAPANWRPDWRDPQVWRMGLILGSSSSMYFAANTFLPDYLHVLGQADKIAATLSSLSFFQIGAPLLVMARPRHLVGHRWPFIAAGTAGFVCLGASVIGRGWGVVGEAGVVGFATALILTICLTLPALLAPPEQVHTISAGMFAISYGCATLFPVIGGVLWDVTAIPEMAFVPALCGAVIVVALSCTLDLHAGVMVGRTPAPADQKSA
jgi:CP family cyanate transporter-like MFS transporter